MAFVNSTPLPLSRASSSRVSTVRRSTISVAPARKAASPSTTASTRSRTAASPHCTLAKPRTKTANIKQLDGPADLDRLLTAQGDTGVTVLMCSAGYCAGCRGAAPKYKKIAAAYADDDDVTFTKMDFVANEQFCRSSLGAENLPFFVVFKDHRVYSAEAMGWRTVSAKLVDRIDSAVSKHAPKSSVVVDVPCPGFSANNGTVQVRVPVSSD